MRLEKRKKRNGLSVAGRGAGGGIETNTYGIDLGTWVQKKLENLSAVPDELDHACREARDFASHFCVSYDIFLIIMEAAKPVFAVCTHDGGFVLFRQPSQNIHTS